MHEDRYNQIRIDEDFTVFKFISEGRHGNLPKIVSFNEIRKNIFNLALGTILSNGEIDFETITNNGDRNKILATVARIASIFIEHYPGKSVYITGSDNRRTLLFQRAISYAYDYLEQMFYVYGDISARTPASEFEPFDTAKNYSGFLIEGK